MGRGEGRGTRQGMLLPQPKDNLDCSYVTRCLLLQILRKYHIGFKHRTNAFAEPVARAGRNWLGEGSLFNSRSVGEGRQ